MLSQDNLVWGARFYRLQREQQTPDRTTPVYVFYLPMNHIASQLGTYMIIIAGGTGYFAEKDAMRGSLINTLAEVRYFVQ